MKPIKIISICILTILLLLLTAIIYNFTNNDSIITDTTTKKSTICFNKTCFELELAITPDAREQGLMNRENLPQDKGMLFIFEEQKIHTFWMKNTIIPLDIIWLDDNLNIVYVTSAEPCIATPCKVYRPTENSLYVLEINQGLAKENNLQKGSQAQLDLHI